MTSHFLVAIVLISSSFLACKSKKEASASQGNSNITEIKGATAETPVKSNVTVDVIEGLNLGNKAPEIMMASPKGNVITLSSLKGKLVLIDFWASWCGPCRKENPTVVAAYNTYNKSKFNNGKGFEILSVSLDQNMGAWVAAIEKDGLVWPYHVSDLAGWDNAAAKKYAVNGIPTNYLVDGDGIIIAKGLRGEALNEALEKIKK